MKKVLTIIMTLILTLGACMGLTACGKDNNKTSKLTGFDVELPRQVVAYLNKTYGTDIEVEFVKMKWEEKESLLSNGSIDLIWNGLTVTPERDEALCLSISYLYNNQVAVVPNAKVNNYKNKADFANAVIGVESGSAGQGVVEGKMGKEMVKQESQLDALVQLSAGTYDAIVIDSIMAGYYTKIGDYKDSLTIVPNLILAEEKYAIGGRKEDKAFVSKINEAIIALYKNGKFGEIATEFGVEESVAINNETTNPLASATDDSWDKIKASKKINIGYTMFAPIAFEK